MFQKYAYVLAVYQERSFTKAAKRLFISQPSLSVAVRNIEQQVGLPLFERHGSLVTPTEIGEAYVEAAQKIHCAEEEYKKKLAEINGLQAGKLVVGGSNYLTADVLPQIISRFRTLHPGVEIVLTEANSLHLRRMLLSEEVDLVIDNFNDISDVYELFELADEQIVLCVPASSRINQKLKAFQILPENVYAGNIQHIPCADISLFKDEPFILLKSGNDMYDRAIHMFATGGIVPNVVFSVDQLNISYALTESELGACFMTDTFFKYRRHTSQVVLYKLQNQMASRTLYMGYKKGRYCTKAMKEFIRIAQEMFRDGK